MRTGVSRLMVTLLAFGFFAWMAAFAPAQSKSSEAGETKNETAPALTFPEGTATPSKVCGECHVSIYKEFQFGFGSDIRYQGIVYKSAKEKLLGLPSEVATSATAHAFAGAEGYPIHAREVEEEGRSCNVCHYPEAFAIPPMESPEIPKPIARSKEKEAAGLTCASCHLTPEGKIRGPYAVRAPHATVEDPAMRTSAICAYCHSLGKRVEGKQTQTFLEWRDDFSRPGLGRQHCQDCHMPRTLRKVAEDSDVPVRAVARHLWTGGHSSQRLRTALNMVVVREAEGKAELTYHVINIGAGHSVPTGSNRRGIYLVTDVLDGNGKVVASREWMFAPWYGNRPDDKAFLEEDKTRKDAVAATQADAQGPHEAPVRAGEERILSWTPDLSPGEYTVNAKLVYDLNRYNERSFTGDQTEIYNTSLPLKVGGK